MNTEMRICVLTYQTEHRKTIDTLCRLKINGYTNVCVYAKPFHYKKRYMPQIPHRPIIDENDSIYTIGYKTIIQNLGYELCKINDYEEIKEKDSTIFLICGAGIIPVEIVQKYYMINAHPGCLPMVRGLDALKWAIMENEPVGVTTHVLGEYVDAGYIIDRRIVPVYENDTFHMVAFRQYEMEIDMLVQALGKIDQFLLFTDGEAYPVHKRMSHEIEKELYSVFEQYKAEHILK